MGGSGWIGQWTQEIEDRANTQLFSHLSYVFHCRVHQRRKAKTDSQAVQAVFHLRDAGPNIHAQRCQHIGGAAFAGDAAVSMFGKWYSGGGDYQCCRGADVERGTATAAGATCVEQLFVPATNRRHAVTHCRGRPGYLFGRFTLGCQRRQEQPDLFCAGHPRHHMADGQCHFFTRQILAGRYTPEQTIERITHGLGIPEGGGAVWGFYREPSQNCSQDWCIMTRRMGFRSVPRASGGKPSPWA